MHTQYGGRLRWKEGTKNIGDIAFIGQMAERFKAMLLKSIIANTIASSNLALPYDLEKAYVTHVGDSYF
jgi:hypothetical protein